ncbi:heterocycloanthracin/sonorensin family bacteriocin [Neobacillus ginsengisoli]|uniref:Heterocycloanthracin/sonorensin family bacteriocin n=1 Tax=Neobacillus ginsengisoli TaxID=904295 RepID=A0ABT9Y0E1_9BACI|nr:heterocycloanthracin/sonorensin family bacteriocin [Neobacillus ginsengisoli]MDQ0201103.1 heterocycloanthracin/sonorensin family bacteriocin [Neobacillus ginsengisoli]
MQNFPNELQMLGLDNYQVGEAIPIGPHQFLEDSRRCGRCGGFGCGGFRCGGFRCGGCFGGLGGLGLGLGLGLLAGACGGCGGCGGCFGCGSCFGFGGFGFGGACSGLGIGFI